MNSYPLISVILPTYLRNDLVVNAIKSIQNQTYLNKEILVVDDSPSREFSKIANNFPDVVVLYTEGKGAPTARNAGILAAKGDYIAFLDDDDEFLPEKLEAHWQAMKSSSLPVSYSWARLVGPDGSERDYCPRYSGQILDMLLVYNFIGTQVLVCEREWLLKNELFFDPDLRKFQDWDLVIRLAEKSSIALVSKILVKVHKHEGQRISTNERTPHGVIYTKYRKQARRLKVLALHLAYLIKSRRLDIFKSYWRAVWQSKT